MAMRIAPPGSSMYFCGSPRTVAILRLDGKEPLDPFEIDIPKRRLIAGLECADDDGHS